MYSAYSNDHTLDDRNVYPLHLEYRQACSGPIVTPSKNVLFLLTVRLILMIIDTVAR